MGGKNHPLETVARAALKADDACRTRPPFGQRDPPGVASFARQGTRPIEQANDQILTHS